jgi:hypothetical protein
MCIGRKGEGGRGGSMYIVQGREGVKIAICTPGIRGVCIACSRESSKKNRGTDRLILSVKRLRDCVRRLKLYMCSYIRAT